jgi:hypothetical protein
MAIEVKVMEMTLDGAALRLPRLWLRRTFALDGRGIFDSFPAWGSCANYHSWEDQLLTVGDLKAIDAARTGRQHIEDIDTFEIVIGGAVLAGSSTPTSPPRTSRPSAVSTGGRSSSRGCGARRTRPSAPARKPVRQAVAQPAADAKQPPKPPPSAPPGASKPAATNPTPTTRPSPSSSAAPAAPMATSTSSPASTAPPASAAPSATAPAKSTRRPSCPSPSPR